MSVLINVSHCNRENPRFQWFSTTEMFLAHWGLQLLSCCPITLRPLGHQFLPGLKWSTVKKVHPFLPLSLERTHITSLTFCWQQWVIRPCLLSSFSPVATPWTVACQAPLSIGFPRQEYWRELPLPSPGGLPDPEMKVPSPAAPALQPGSLPLSHQEGLA